jgi:hypothetical protein
MSEASRLTTTAYLNGDPAARPRSRHRSSSGFHPQRSRWPAAIFLGAEPLALAVGSDDKVDQVPQPGCHLVSPASRRAALSAVEAARDIPGSRLRIIATLAIANQATHVSWAMYVIQPLAE